MYSLCMLLADGQACAKAYIILYTVGTTVCEYRITVYLCTREILIFGAWDAVNRVLIHLWLKVGCLAFSIDQHKMNSVDRNDFDALSKVGS